MTRATLNRTLRRLYVIVTILLGITLVAKLADHIPLLEGSGLERVLRDLYDYLKDMSLVFITVVAAYLANVFQKRQGFVSSLHEEWRDIIATKSALFEYCETENPTKPDYLKAFLRLSETIDNMRIVYCNVGETKSLVGLFPFTPLHDMRRALQSIQPSQEEADDPAHRKLVKDAILQSFYALREGFLEELDLEEPTNPILPTASRRLKKPGTAAEAKLQRDAQRRAQKQGGGHKDIESLLQRLRSEEIESEQARAQGGRVGS